MGIHNITVLSSLHHDSTSSLQVAVQVDPDKGNWRDRAKRHSHSSAGGEHAQRRPSPARRATTAVAVTANKKLQLALLEDVIVRCDGCGLTTVPEPIFQKARLQELILSSNAIPGLPPALCAMAGLRVLRLSRNLLTAIPPEVVGMASLQLLDVSYNLIQGVPLQLGLLLQLHSVNLFENPLDDRLPDAPTGAAGGVSQRQAAAEEEGSSGRVADNAEEGADGEGCPMTYADVYFGPAPGGAVLSASSRDAAAQLRARTRALLAYLRQHLLQGGHADGGGGEGGDTPGEELRAHLHAQQVAYCRERLAAASGVADLDVLSKRLDAAHKLRMGEEGAAAQGASGSGKGHAKGLAGDGQEGGEGGAGPPPELERARHALAICHRLRVATASLDVGQLRGSMAAWRDHCRPAAPEGPDYDAAAAAYQVLRRHELESGLLLQDQQRQGGEPAAGTSSAGAQRASLPGGRSRAASSRSAPRSALTSAGGAFSTQRMRGTGARTFDDWRAEKVAEKAAAQERFMAFQAALAEQARLRREQERKREDWSKVREKRWPEHTRLAPKQSFNVYAAPGHDSSGHTLASGLGTSMASRPGSQGLGSCGGDGNGGQAAATASTPGSARALRPTLSSDRQRAAAHPPAAAAGARSGSSRGSSTSGVAAAATASALAPLARVGGDSGRRQGLPPVHPHTHTRASHDGEEATGTPAVVDPSVVSASFADFTSPGFADAFKASGSYRRPRTAAESEKVASAALQEFYLQMAKDRGSAAAAARAPGAPATSTVAAADEDAYSEDGEHAAAAGSGGGDDVHADEVGDPAGGDRGGDGGGDEGGGIHGEEVEEVDPDPGDRDSDAGEVPSATVSDDDIAEEC